MIIIDPANPVTKFSILNKGLVGHWRVDEESFNPATKRFTDQSAYCNHGTGHGTQLGSATPGFQADRMGQLVRAAPFNGSDDFINCGNDNGLNFGSEDFTIGLWVKLATPVTLSDFIIAKYDNLVSSARWSIEVRTTGYIIARMRDSDGDQASAIGDIAVGDSIWHHIIVYRSGTTIYLYVDNTFDASNTNASVGNVDVAADLKIGTLYADGVNTLFFAGVMLDVRIYNRALSQQEITLLYESYRPAWKLGT